MTPRDSFIALAIIVIWALHTVVIRIGVMEIPPFLLLTFRMAGTALLFAPFAKKVTREQFFNIARWSMVFIFIHVGTLGLALRYIDSGLGALFLQTNTPFALLIGWMLHKEKFGWRTAAGLVLSFLGVVIVLYKPGGNFTYLGAGLMLLSAFMWGLGSFMSRKTADVDIITLAAIGYGLPLPLFALLSYLFEPGQIAILLHEADWYILGSVLLFQCAIASFAHMFWRDLMVRNPAYLVTCFTFIQPALTLLMGHWILGEVLNATTYIGGAVSMTGVAIVLIRRLQRSRDTTRLTTDPNPDAPNP
jgi:O-acetylserine/cysteine efflux transporter